VDIVSLYPAVRKLFVRMSRDVCNGIDYVDIKPHPFTSWFVIKIRLSQLQDYRMQYSDLCGENDLQPNKG